MRPEQKPLSTLNSDLASKTSELRTKASKLQHIIIMENRIFKEFAKRCDKKRLGIKLQGAWTLH